MRRLGRVLVLALVIVGLGLANIGGCGGGGNGGGGFTPRCNMPPLDTDFGDLVYFFLDLQNQVELGVSSGGLGMAFSLFDIGTTDGLFFTGVVTGPNTCNVTGITDLDIILPASGTCERQDDGGVFVVNDLNAIGTFIPQLVASCDEVISTNTASLSVRSLIDGSISTRSDDQATEQEIAELTERFREILESMGSKE